MPKLPSKRERQLSLAMVSATEPLSFRCQSCDALLTFIDSIVGGVQPIERWDRYVCRRCGTAFEYRARTRALKRTA